MLISPLIFLALTVAGIRVARTRWDEIRASKHFTLGYPLAHLVWLLLYIVVLSNTVATLAEIEFVWGAIGKILTLGVLLAWPVVVMPPRAMPWFAAGWALVLTLLGLCDLGYWRHFGGLFPLTALLGSGQAWDVRESIQVVLRLEDLWLLPTALAGLVLVAGVPRVSRLPGSRRPLLLRVGVAVLVGMGVMTYHLTSDRGRKVLSHASWSQHVGVYGVHLLDTARIVGEWWRRGDLDEETLADVRGYLDRQQLERPIPHDSDLFGVAAGSNVLIVQLEGVQEFVIGAEVYGTPVTPFLNSMRESAAYYPWIADQSGEANTADTGYMLNNSQHPMRRGAVVFRRPDNTFVTWTRMLRDAGYTTLSAHPWERGFWNRAVVHPRYGFERMMFRRELGGIIDKVGWGSSDRAFYEKMVPILSDLESPYVAYLITLMSHHPYTFYPEERRQLDLGGLDDDSMLGAYLQMMHEVDASLKDFVEQLTVAGALDNTILVVLGDHDARLELPDDVVAAGSRALGMSREDLVHVSGRDPRTDFVPLFIRVPGGELKGIMPVVGGQMDIGPTLVFLLGLEQPDSFLGRPLLPDTEGFVARIDGSALDQDHLFASQGVNVPVGGVCLSLPDRREVPREECRDIADRANEQVRISWKITELDMASRLDPPPTLPDQTSARRH